MKTEGGKENCSDAKKREDAQKVDFSFNCRKKWL